MQLTLLKKLFWVVGVALFAAGLYGWYDRFVYGHLHANYGSVVPWGLWVASYIYFIGLSAGSFLISSLVYVFNVQRFERIGRLAVFTAVVTLLLALLSIWADLGHMFRAWHVLAYPNFQSPMAWMIWLYSAYFLLLVVELWFLLRADMAAGTDQPGLRGRLYRLLTLGSRDTSDTARRRDRTVVRVLATIGVPVAIMFHGGVGALFGVVAARPGWHSGMFPILFLLSALVSGGALLAMIAAIFQDGFQRNRNIVVLLGRVVLGLLLLDVLFQISDLLVAFYGNIPGDIASLRLMIGGPFWWVFWGWQIVLGTLIPIMILVLPTRTSPRWVALAGLLIAFGFLSVRLNIVIPSLAIEEVTGLSRAFASPRMATSYVPSLTEWLLTIGVVGLGMLLFGLGEWLLPKGDQDVNIVEQPVAPVVAAEASYVH
jgi:molybdopterin-containing oxidoreductase family membrane subunit